MQTFSRGCEADLTHVYLAAVYPCLYAANEAVPASRGKKYFWATWIFAVADSDDASGYAHFYAVPAIATAVAGLTPADAAQVHVLATSSSSSREALRGSASDLSVSHMSMSELTSSADSTICPATAVSW